MHLPDTVFFLFIVHLVSSVAAQTRLMLNTRSTPGTPTAIDINTLASLKQSSFSAKKPTKILIHGYVDRYTNFWWNNMVEELLKVDDLNVFRVDWSFGNSGLYSQAASNSGLVGTQLASFIQVLISDYKQSPNQLHLIGHSLGAHTAGVIGEILKSKSISLERITGLDPAGLGFTNTAPSSRLDPGDAKVVDTIMTDGLLLGSPQSMGHINFLPNGGMSQPICLVSSICSHLRSITLFTESINKKPPVYGQLCDSYSTFVRGGCSSQIRSPLGYHADLSLKNNNEQLKFFSTT